MTFDPGTPAASSAAVSFRGVRLELLAAHCASGTCPTIYKSDRGTVVVQGYELTADHGGVELASGEQLVEIPLDLLVAAAREVS